MKILAVDNNYNFHNKAPKGTLYSQEEPVIFTKADSALLRNRKPFFIPDFMGEIDYAVHVVVRISRLGKCIPERYAHRYYDAVTLGIDFTATDLLHKFSDAGQPWELSKGFDCSAAVGEWVDKSKFLNLQSLRFRLDINGEARQEGCTAEMRFKIDALVAYVSRFFTLKTGDLIFTGTPEGVGPVQIDDLLEGYIEDRKVLEIRCK